MEFIISCYFSHVNDSEYIGREKEKYITSWIQLRKGFREWAGFREESFVVFMSALYSVLQTDHNLTRALLLNVRTIQLPRSRGYSVSRAQPHHRLHCT